jgi:hypothetical protein
MRFVEGPPTFAAEVRSENDYGDAAEADMAAKRPDYFAAGTAVVWDVDPLAETVAVYRATAPTQPTVYRPGDTAEAEPAVPGWSMPVDEIVLESNWLGFPGAREWQIDAAEARLGTKLPPSYRDFLKTTNGWRQIKDWLPASAGHFLSAEEMDWFAIKHLAWLQGWMEGVKSGEAQYGPSPPIPDEQYFVYSPDQSSTDLRDEYLETALAISEEGDAAICLLNPKIVTAEGEWEAWFFANWHPGAVRYRSFREMMEAHYRRFLKDPDCRRF